MNDPIRILYVDDSPFDRELVRDALEKEHGGFDLTTVASRIDFESALAVGGFALILSDFNILGFDGLQVLDIVHAQNPTLPVIIVTGTGSEVVAVEALKRGAADYVIKTPNHIRRLPLAIHAVLEKRRMDRELNESRLQMAGIFNTMLDALITVDEKQTIVVFNPAAEQMFRCKASEAIGQPLDRFLPEAMRATHIAYLRGFGESNSTARTMKSSALDLTCLRADGEPFASEVSISQLTLGNKKLFTAIVRDITERKQAEEALANEKNLLRTLIDHLPDSIYAKDLQGRFILKNVAGARLLGADSPDEAISKTDFDFYAPEMAAEFRADDLSVMQSGQPIINHEELVTGATGQTSWISTTKVPLRDRQGNIIGLVGIGHDITEQRRAAARIETQMHRLAALHAIDIAITSNMDLAQTLDVALKQTITHLGVDAASVLLLDKDKNTLAYVAGRGFRTPLVKEIVVHLGQGMVGQAVLERRMAWADDISQIQESQRLIALWEPEGFVVYHGIPLIAKDRIIGLLEVFRRTPRSSDDEWRSFLETLAGQAAIAVDNATLFAETQAQAQLTQQIIDSSPEGILLLDQAQRLILTNPTALALLPDLAHLAPGDLVTTLGNQPLSAFLNTDLTDQSRHELRLDDPYRILEVAVQPLAPGLHIGSTLFVIWDMTAEQERQRYQQAQERLASVGQLAAGIAHDFNNIMGAIVLYAQLLGKATNLSDRQRGQLLTIQDQAKHATSLIRQILDFSRRSFMQKMALDLAPLVKEMIKLLERTLPENVRLVLTYDRAEYAIFGDPTRIQQVLMNLAFNARDAMPNGGDLRFALSILSLGTDQAPPLPDMEPGEWVSLVVSDTGTGIEPAHLLRIFDPFFTTKEPGKGTGLGLSQVYGIVKQHGGSIFAESHVGQGTAFTLYLPLHLAPLDENAVDLGEEPIPIPGHGETILLVEDNEALRQSVQGALEDLGYVVKSASNGRQALEIISQQSDEVSLMLSDLVMPQMGGIELGQIVLQRYPKTRILIMTGHPRGDGEGELHDTGIAGWIQKPFTIPDLAVKIRGILDGTGPGLG